ERFECCRIGLALRVGDGDHPNKRETDNGKNHSDYVYECRSSLDCDYEAAERRADHRSDLPYAAVPCDGIAEYIGGNDLRKQCRSSRGIECPRNAAQQQECVDEPDRSAR